MGLRWDRGERALVLRDDHITLQTPDGDLTGSLERMQSTVLRELGLGVLVEALAAAEHPEVLAAPRPGRAGLEDRRRIPRSFGRFVRGQVHPAAHIDGDRVRVRLPGGDTHEASIDEVAASGLPERFAHALGASDTDALLDAVRRLSAASCDCGTTDQARTWRHLERLASHQDPRAPITVAASVCRCTVCGRVWTLTESGDSHYGWTYGASLFSGQPA